VLLRRRWCETIVLDLLALTGDKTDDTKGSLWEELEHLCEKPPKYHNNL
jgi:hypothetical protein